MIITKATNKLMTTEKPIVVMVIVDIPVKEMVTV